MYVSMCACIYWSVVIHISIHVCVYIYRCTHACMYIKRACMFVYASMYVYKRVCVHASICLYVLMFVCTDVAMCACLYREMWTPMWRHKMPYLHRSFSAKEPYT